MKEHCGQPMMGREYDWGSPGRYDGDDYERPFDTKNKYGSASV